MIKIKDDFYLKSYPYGYIITKDSKRIDKDGNKIYTDLVYLTTIEGVLNWLIRYEQRKKVNEVNSLQELLIEFKKVNEETKELLNVLKNLEEI